MAPSRPWRPASSKVPPSVLLCLAGCPSYLISSIMRFCQCHSSAGRSLNCILLQIPHSLTGVLLVHAMLWTGEVFLLTSLVACTWCPSFALVAV